MHCDYTTSVKHYSINEFQHTIEVSSLSFWCLFYPKSCYLLPPRLISSLFFCVPGEALQLGPFQQLPPNNNKKIVLFYFIFPPLHLSGAITLPYSAYDLGAMGGGVHWPWMIMSFHTAEIYELRTSLVVVLQLFGFVAAQQNGGEYCPHCGLLVTVFYVIITFSISPLKTEDETFIHLFILKADGGGHPTFDLYECPDYVTVPQRIFLFLYILTYLLESYLC